MRELIAALEKMPHIGKNFVYSEDQLSVTLDAFSQARLESIAKRHGLRKKEKKLPGYALVFEPQKPGENFGQVIQIALRKNIGEHMRGKTIFDVRTAVQIHPFWRERIIKFFDALKPTSLKVVKT